MYRRFDCIFYDRCLFEVAKRHNGNFKWACPIYCSAETTSRYIPEQPEPTCIPSPSGRRMGKGSRAGLLRHLWSDPQITQRLIESYIRLQGNRRKMSEEWQMDPRSLSSAVHNHVPAEIRFNIRGPYRRVGVTG
jgi:hypothetical protein